MFRRKYRDQRRHGLPLENPFIFYGKYALHVLSWALKLTLMMARMELRLRRVEKDPDKLSYTDLALTPVSDEELEQLDIIKETNPAAVKPGKIHIYPNRKVMGSGAEALN